MYKIEDQLALEEEAILNTTNKVESMFIATLNQNRLNDSSIGITLLRISIPLVSQKIRELFDSDTRGEVRKNITIIQDLFYKEETKLAYIVLNSLLSKVALKPMGLVSLSHRVMKDIELVLLVEKFKEDHPKLYVYIDEVYKKRGKNIRYTNKKKITLTKLKGYVNDVEFTTRLGTLLIETVVNSGCNLFKFIKHSASEATKLFLSDEAIEMITRKKQSLMKDAFQYNPLIIEPKDHTSLIGSGGYYSYSNIPLVKAKSKHLGLINEAFNNCTEVLDILNKIQKTKWRVNTRIIEVIDEIINNNILNTNTPLTNPTLLGNIPYMEVLQLDHQVPKEPYGKIGSDGKFIFKKDFDRWYNDRMQQESVNQKIVSKRLAFLLALDKAKKYSHYSYFYYTYQFDYRYRLYPLQEHLSPQTASNVKAMLEFAEGQVLNEEGLYWLKVHGANCYGKDKAPYEDRVKFIDNETENIKKIVKDPILYKEYWKDSEEPLLYLAFCFSYVDYLTNKYAKIHIPVQLDATCSGLQIYSGLLRDADGGKSVNVIGNTRQDIYQEVADKVNQYLVNNDVEQELTFKTKDGVTKCINVGIEARSMTNKITRKLVKRNVMTTPYSVTTRGMFEQIQEILDEQELNDEQWWKGDKWVIARLLSRLNSRAISEIVKGATQGQKFIKYVTDNIARTNAYLTWYSPIYKLPMLHRMPKENKQNVSTPFGRLIVYKQTKDINKQKMLSSIAPNFIHQLDAMLMYRAVEKCLAEGITNYWLIHDSYGVLPNDIPILNKNIRESYVELFSKPILKDWVKQVAPHLEEEVDSVMLNTLDLNDVLTSKYIFS